MCAGVVLWMEGGQEPLQARAGSSYGIPESDFITDHDRTGAIAVYPTVRCTHAFINYRRTDVLCRFIRFLTIYFCCHEFFPSSAGRKTGRPGHERSMHVITIAY